MPGMIPEWARRARGAWTHTGRSRPPFAIPPGPGQESVWDYPRPPAIDPIASEVVVRAGTVVIARSTACVRVLETASPPTIYIPPADVVMADLVPASGESFCEWKGAARYWSVVIPGERLERVAWSYPDPLGEFRQLRDYVSFYPARLDCRIDGVRATPQAGGFYGGWITPDIVGPFKGDPGTAGW
jgi:uncharacterized protein (DUF427 family)